MTTATQEAPATEAPEEVEGAESGEENIVPFPGVNGKPGDQGIATQDDEEVVQEYEPPEPSEGELKIADEIFQELDNRAKLADEDIVSGLIRLVDVHKQFLTPQDLFSTTDEVFAGAAVIDEIARLLCRCTRIEVSYRKLGFWFKDHEKWTSDGQTVDAQVKRFDGFQQHINEGMVAAIVVNYHHWKTLNPRQKVFTVYHALRQLDEKGKRSAPDWVGYFDEPSLFGAGVHREMVTMARAFVKDAPERAGEPYQLSILDEVYDGE